MKDSNTSLQYGSFLKSATLLANVGTEQDIEGHVSTHDIEIKPIKVLSDEDLFKACNGRTAHKGARHGLTLSGKLHRIAEQEKFLLEKMKGKQNKHEVFRETVTKKRKQIPLAELNLSKDEETSDDNQLPVDTESDYILKCSKKRKKRDKTAELNLVRQIECIGIATSIKPELLSEPVKDEVPYNGTPVRKKKKSKYTEKLDSIQETEQSEDEQRKKRNKRQKDPSSNLPTIGKSRKKKKKSNNSVNQFELLNEVQSSDGQPEQPEKRKKIGKRKADEDEEMIGSKVSLPEIKTKKVKLDSSYDSNGEDVDIVDKINSERAARKLHKVRKNSKQAKRKEKQVLKKLAAL